MSIRGPLRLPSFLSHVYVSACAINLWYLLETTSFVRHSKPHTATAMFADDRMRTNEIFKIYYPFDLEATSTLPRRVNMKFLLLVAFLQDWELFPIILRKIKKELKNFRSCRKLENSSLSHIGGFFPKKVSENLRACGELKGLLKIREKFLIFACRNHPSFCIIQVD